MADSGNKLAGVGIVVVAALLVELISIMQYTRLRRMVQDELDLRAQSVLSAVADNIANTLDLTEATMRENLWVVRGSLSDPDSLFTAIVHMIDDNPQVVGGCLAFVPDYYPNRGALFEPYVSKENGRFRMEQIAGPDHDYTQNPAFRSVLENKGPIWSDPYRYGSDSQVSLTTYSTPVLDEAGNVAAVCGLDMDLSWLGDILNNRQPYPSSFALLLTQDGMLVAGPPASRAKPADVEHAVSLLNQGESVSDDKEFFIRRTRLEKSPHWQVAQVYYADEVFAPLRKVRLRQMLWVLSGLLILFFMIERYSRNENKLRLANIEQARIGSELSIARKIQMEMLPTSFPAEIAGLLLPAREVGGDLFDFYTRDGKLLFCIGDVSGKGVPAAMVMSVTHTLFRIVSSHEDSPGRILGILNEEGCRDNASNMFVTFFVGILDLTTGKLRYGNAGHEKPVLVADGVAPLPAKANYPLGVFPETEYEEQDCTLGAGTTILLYTDGLTEARNQARQQFGRNRVMEVLDTCRTDPEMTPDRMVTALSDAVHRFSDGMQQSDDLTLLAVRYPGPSDQTFFSDGITLKNDVQEVSRLSSFVKAFHAKLPIDDKTASHIRLALEEIVVNVISYAYALGEPGDIQIEARFADGKVCYTVVDSGIPFDPTQAKGADISGNVNDRPIGGLGILLATKVMDTISYRRDGSSNELTLTKSIA